VEQVKNYILTLNNSLLEKLTSKGDLKRAYKDYEKKGLIPHIEENSKEIKWTYSSSGISCSIITADLTKAECSCPSSRICRHILTGLIHLQTVYKRTFEGEIKDDKEVDQWKNLYSVTDKELKGIIGKRKLETSLEALATGMKVNVVTGDTIDVLFPDLSIKCTFLPHSPPLAGICSCKKNICDHKIIALLKLQLEKGIRVISPSEFKKFSASNLSALKKLEELLIELLTTGLERASSQILQSNRKITPPVIGKLEALAIELHNENMPRLAKEVRSVQSQIENYVKKSSQFDIQTYMKLLSRIYGIIKLIQNYDGSYPLTDITGLHKTKYIEIGNVSLSGIGCRAWRTQTKYAGLTAYFLSENKDQFLTFSISRPEIYDTNPFIPATAYYSEFPWDGNNSLQTISRKNISLINGSKNIEGRLSSSKDTKILVKSDVTFRELENSPLSISNWEILVNRMSDINRNIYIREKENRTLFFLKFSDWEKPIFNEIKQELTQKILDGEKREIYIRVPFKPLEELTIKNLEFLYAKNKKPAAILGYVSIDNGYVFLLPVTAYLHVQDNLKEYTLNLNLEKAVDNVE